jgi:hypothetical protein
MYVILEFHSDIGLDYMKSEPCHCIERISYPVLCLGFDPRFLSYHLRVCYETQDS